MSILLKAFIWSCCTLSASPRALAAYPFIKIGYVGALSGSKSSESAKALKALELAVSEKNQNGGIGGRQLRVLSYDNKQSPINHLALFRQMKKDGIIALTGVHNSNDGLVVAKLAEKYHLPTIVTTATHPGIVGSKGYTVQLCFNNNQEAAALSKLALGRLHAKHAIMIIDVGDSFSQSLAELFKQKFERGGGTVLQTFPIRSTEREFQSVLAELIAMKRKPDVVFSAAGAMESGYLMSALAANELSIPVIGNDGWQGDGLILVLSKLSLRNSTAYFPTHWNEQFRGGVARAFLTAYKKKHGTQLTNADVDAAMTYDAGYYLFSALERAGSVDPNLLIRALRNGKIEGVTGVINIRDGTAWNRTLSIQPIKNGQVSSEVLGGVAE